MLQVHVVFLLIPDPVEVFALDFILTLAGASVVRSCIAVAEETPMPLNQGCSVNVPVNRVVSSTLYDFYLLSVE